MTLLQRALIISALLLALVAGTAAAETRYLCSLTESTECSEGVECGPPDFAGVVPPTFMYVDINKSMITLLAPATRRGEETAIDVARETASGWILSGVESERAWSIILTDEGNLTLTVTMDGTTWTGFGRCMPAADAKP